MAVGVNNAGVPVISVIYAPDLIGVYLVTFQVQPGMAAGTYSLALLMHDANGRAVYSQTALIPVD